MDKVNDVSRKEKLSEEIIHYIRKRLSAKMNYLIPILYYLTLFPVEEAEPLATDGKYLFYNPQYVIQTYKNYPQKLQVEYMHILGHCILGHVGKRNGTHEKIYDAATDYAVTRFISNMGMKGIKERTNFNEVTDKRFVDTILKHKGTTGFYDYLCHNPKLCQEVLLMDKKLHKDNHNYWNRLHPELAKKLKTDGRWKNGGHSIGQWYKQYQQDIINSWAKLMNMAEYMGRTDVNNPVWGRHAGRIAREFIMSSENDISYKDFLRRFMVLQEKQKINPDSFDYTWYTIGIQQYKNIPLIEPLEACEDRVVDDLIIALDTSGSCINIMNRFLRETYNILSDMEIDKNVNIRILQCDTRIRDDRVIHKSEDLPNFELGFKVKGFGGTSFIPVFKHIDELQKKGEIKRVRGLLYFSDGYGDFPEKPSEYETVFIFPPNQYINMEIPKWVTKIKLTEEDMEYNI